jgi:hypothetical protein
VPQITHNRSDSVSLIFIGRRPDDTVIQFRLNGNRYTEYGRVALDDLLAGASSATGSQPGGWWFSN